MNKHYMALAALVFFIPSTFGSPSEASDVKSAINKSIKRSESSRAKIVHARTCGCTKCFNQKIKEPSLDSGRSRDMITNPCLQVVCCPPMYIADWIVEDSDRVRDRDRMREYARQHRLWHHNNGGERSESDKEEVCDPMEVPRPMFPMSQDLDSLNSQE